MLLEKQFRESQSQISWAQAVENVLGMPDHSFCLPVGGRVEQTRCVMSDGGSLQETLELS